MLKKCIFLSLLSLSVCAFAQNHGDNNYPARNVDSNNARQPKLSSRQKIKQMKDRIITPDAGPRIAKGAGIFTTADFIYWAVKEDGLAYAFTGNGRFGFDNTGKFVGVNAVNGSVYGGPKSQDQNL